MFTTFRNPVIRNLQGFFDATDSGGQSRQGRLAEQHANIGIQIKLAHTLDQLHRQQRMAAQLEEVIVATDLRNTQYLRPEAGQGRFDVASRCFIGLADECRGIWRGQGATVQLAVGRYRHFFQLDISGRDHVVRQACLQVSAQHIGRGRFLAWLLGEIGNQALVAGVVFASQYRCITHSDVIGQAGFDFTQLDPETTDLDLVIVTAQVLDDAIGVAAAKVAGLVQAALDKRITQKTLGGQFVTVQVTPCNTSPANVDLTRNANRYGLELLIEQVNPGVGYRHANGWQGWPVRHAHRQGKRSGDMGFGRAVVVMQPTLGQMLEQCTDRCGNAQLLTGGDDLAQGAGLLTQRRIIDQRLGQCLQGNARQIEALDTRFAQVQVQLAQVQSGIGMNQRQWRTGAQRTEDFLEGDVKAKRRKLHGRRSRIATFDALGKLPMHQVDQRAVRHGHALGLTSGTRGVDDVGQMLRTKPLGGQFRVVLRLATEFFCPFGQAVEQHTGHGGFTEQPGDAGLAEHGLGCSIAKHVFKAFSRVIRVERHIPCTSLENAQQAGNHFRTPAAADRNTVVEANSQLQQTMSNAVGLAIQLAVGHTLRLESHRQRVRLTLGLGLEQLMHQQMRCKGLITGIEAMQQLLAFAIRHECQVLQCDLVSAVQCIGQFGQHRLHVIGNTLCADAWHDLYGQAEGITQIVHRKRQRIVGALLTACQLEARPLQTCSTGRCANRCMAIVEQGAEQRRRCRNAATALRQGQRRMLMAEQGRQSVMGRSCCDPDTWPLRRDTQRQGIDEHAQSALGVLAALQSSHQHRAEHHILTARQAPHHLPPSQMMKAGIADTQAAGMGAQALSESVVQRQYGLFDCAAVTLNILQTEWQRWLIHIP
ncbi:hypothetical protein PSCICN_09320 [Pseudomonas cichorii]|nr:hypothetical protein PSCICN_09320 [Pseudomonas cichorii]